METATRTWHDEPAFLQAHALFVVIPESNRALLPPGALGAFAFGRYEFTDGDLHLPTEWIEPDLADDITGAQALAQLEAALNQLIADSTDLATTLRYLRARTQIRVAAEDLASLHRSPDQDPETGSDSPRGSDGAPA